MRITPLDIQQMVFNASFRGYDKEEVNRFLEELAQTIESLNRDQAVQREKIVFLEQQLAELKRTEATLSSTLLSAQSLAEDVKRNAQREADLVIKEAELKAGELIRQAGVELTDTQRDLSSLQKQRLLMVERLRASLRMFERMLEVEEQEALHDAAIASEEKLEESRARRCDLLDLTDLCPLMRFLLCFVPPASSRFPHSKVLRPWLPITSFRRRCNRPSTTVSFPAPSWRCVSAAN